MVEWIYLIGIIPAFILMFRSFYLQDAREATSYISDAEITSWAVVKSALCTPLWPLFVVFFLVGFSIIWVGKLLKRMLKL